MSGNCPRRQSPFVLNGTGEGDGVIDQVGGVASSFDGLTIVSAPDDEASGWMGVEPSCLPLSAPARGVRTSSRALLGTLSVASSMTDPPTICSGVPASRAESSRGGGVLTVFGSPHWTGTLYRQSTVSCGGRSWFMSVQTKGFVLG